MTARKPLTRNATETQKREPVRAAATGPQETIFSFRPMMTKPRVAAFGVAILVIAMLAFWLLRESHGKSSTPISAAEPTSRDTAALEALATRFVDDNRWDASAIEAFLQTWRATDIGIRAAAMERPALTRLREQITYNERVTTVLLDDSAPGSGKLEQAKALREFDQELGGVR